MKSFNLTTEAARAERKWKVVDVDGQTLGRVATKIASILRGKENPKYTPHVDSGDGVIVINASKVRFTGNKLAGKLYRHHTGYIGGVKEFTAEELLKKNPEEVIRRAVQGMLPKNTLGRDQLKKLKIYPGPDHIHQAQKAEQA